MYTTYILYSYSLGKYYVGYTKDLEKRLNEHNNGNSKFTRIGIPWEVVKIIKVDTKKEAMILEKKIKKRGCKRYLYDLETQKSSLK